MDSRETTHQSFPATDDAGFRQAVARGFHRLYIDESLADRQAHLCFVTPAGYPIVADAGVNGHPAPAD